MASRPSLELAFYEADAVYCPTRKRTGGDSNHDESRLLGLKRASGHDRLVEGHDILSNFHAAGSPRREE